VAEIRVGTCSWADETLTSVWYPDGVAAGERLAWYAERFDVVEANSTYYRLPERPLVERWAERTPPGFTMHVKAYGAMTRHPMPVKSLPPDLRDVPADHRGRIERPPREWRSEVFRRFADAVEPLREAGKLGGIEFQLAPFVVRKPRWFEYLEWAQEQLPGHDLLVEFRHRSWLDEDGRAETLRFLEERGMTLVVLDAPENAMPTVPAVTSDTAYVRFHGRNATTWHKRTGSAAERFDYLYSDEELREWVPTLRELAGQAQQAFALFNNNGVSEGPGGGPLAQAPTNAAMLRALLGEC
jgi:uncharacterized protein YecE (DUF72 family)